MLRTILEHKGKVYIHCRGGHGRSAMIAAIVIAIVNNDISANDALLVVFGAHQSRKVMKPKWRFLGAPQTRSQKEFVRSYIKYARESESLDYIDIYRPPKLKLALNFPLKQDRKTHIENITVSIIGTSGKKSEPRNAMLNADLYNKMVERARAIIEEIRGDRNMNFPIKASAKKLTLVSGGSSWADHVAVTLFLEGESNDLVLHLPCEFDVNSKKFADDGRYDWRVNPGRTLNHYHKLFSDKIERDTLNDISLSTQLNTPAQLVISNSFHSRNTKVATSNILIAFSWSTTGEPDDGGTLDTWNKAPMNTKKIHVSLDRL